MNLVDAVKIILKFFNDNISNDDYIVEKLNLTEEKWEEIDNALEFLKDLLLDYHVEE